MRRVSVLLVASTLSWLVACSSEGEDPEAVEAWVSGSAFFEGPLDHAKVVVFSSIEGESVASETETDEYGAWSAAVGPVSGALRVEVSNSGTRMSSLVEDLDLGGSVEDVQVTPVTTLMATYVRFLKSRGIERDEAVARARGAVYGHFGGVEHGKLQAISSQDWGGSISDGDVVGALIAAFAEQTSAMNKEMGTSETAGALLRLYTEDLSSDGLLDGKGENGRQLRFALRDLHGDSLRMEYSWALEDYLKSSRNVSEYGASDFGMLLEAIAKSDSEIFPRSALAERDEESPSVLALEIVDFDGVALPWREKPIGGLVYALIRTSDEKSGVGKIEAIGTATEAAGRDILTDEESAMIALRTTELDDGVHTVGFVVTDRYRNESTAEIEFGVDNHAPRLTVEMEHGGGESVRIVGTWEDEGPWRVDVAIEVDDVEQSRLFDAPASFVGQAIVSCNGRPVRVKVKAIDKGGNESSPRTEWVSCEVEGPQIVIKPTNFVQESDLEPILLEAGPSQPRAAVRYDPRGRARILRFDESSQWPVTIEKYFNRFDSGSENLPVFRFRAVDSDTVDSAEYRYLVDGIEKKGWMELELNQVGEFEIEGSYQNLGTELVLSQGSLHEVEVRVTDQDGRSRRRIVSFYVTVLSPPAWIDGCSVVSPPRWNTLRTTFHSGTSIGVAQGRVRYILGLSASSMAPRDGIDVEMYAGPGRIDVVRIDEEKFAEPDWVRQPDHDPSWQNTIPNCLEEDPTHEVSWLGSTVCGRDSFPNRISYTRGQAGTPSGLPFQSTVQGVVNAKFRQSAGVSAGGNGYFELLPEYEGEVEVEVMNPRLEVDSGLYQWSQTLPGVPQSYVSANNVDGWYWLDARYQHSGADLGGELWECEPWPGRHLNCDEPHRTIWHDARRFTTRMALAGIEIEVPQVEVSARSRLLNAGIEVRRAPECEGPMVLSIE